MREEPAAHLTPPERRVALLVVPGVGDKGPGDDLDTVTAALVAEAGFRDAQRHDLVLVPDYGDRASTEARAEDGYRTPWCRLRPSGGAPVVDVYELYWADLSRFPAGLLRFLYTAYALFLELATIGLEALRATRAVGLRRAAAARAALVALSWVLAVPVLASTGVLVLLTAALFVAVTLSDRPALVVGATVTFGVGALVAGWWGGTRLRRGGWRGALPLLLLLVAAATVAGTAWRIVRDESVAVGLANSLMLATAYPFRIAWLAAAALAAVAALALVALVPARDGQAVGERLRAAYTGLLTVAIGTVGIAVAGAVVLASFAALALPSADDARWGPRAERVLCLEQRTALAPERCRALAARELAVAERSGAAPQVTRLLAQERALLVRAEDLSRAVRQARSAAQFDVARGLAFQAGALRGEANAVRAALGDRSPAADVYPTEWATRLFGQALAPLYMALLVGLALGVLALVALLPLLLTAALRPLSRDDAGAASVAEGGALGFALRSLGARPGLVPLLAGLLVAAGAVGWVWIADADLGSADVGGGLASLGALVGALLLAVRALGISPRRPFGSASGNLEKLRRGLDLAYDIATYLRVAQPGVVAPRERMLARYRALVEHVAAGGVDGRPYDALVVVAHSQGTVLSAAALFGDRHRDPQAHPLRAFAEFPCVSLLTFGSPLRQIYDARFPGQYEWVRDPLAHPGLTRVLRGEWVNLYRAGDYVGRELWSERGEEQRYDPGVLAFTGTAPNLTLREFCLGTGSHTGYWSDPRFVPVLRYLVLRAGGVPAPWPGPLDEPRPARPGGP